MSRKRVLCIVVAVLAVGWVVPSLAQTNPGASADIDFDALAEKLVNQCAGIREGDLVRVSGGARDCKLLEDVAVQVRRKGAFPLVTLSSDRMNRRMYDDVPEKYDYQTSDIMVKLASMITARIHVDYSESEANLEGVPSARIAAVNKANAPSWDLMLKRKVRQVYLGNDLYPTKERANLYGVSQEKLARIFWDGVNTDYNELQQIGQSVREVMANGKDIRITHPNGTDLKVKIAGQRVFVSDGVIAPEDMAEGHAGCLVWLPAGEVYVSAVAGTAEGKVVVEQQFFQGKEIKGFTMIFKEGKLVDMEAKSGLKPLKEMYEAQYPNKELFSVIDIGINPSVELIPGSKMVAWMASGMVTVGVGDNTWAGGDNSSPLELYGHLTGVTLKVDGQVVVEDGKLKK